MSSLLTDFAYLFVVLFGMFAHYMKQRVRNQTTSVSLWDYFQDSFWKTTFPAILAGVAFLYGSLQGAPEFFYPLNKMAAVWALMSGYTSDSLLNGETTSTPSKP